MMREKKPEKSNNGRKKYFSGDRRITLLLFVVLGVAAVVSVRLYSLQVGAHEAYEQQAENQRSASSQIQPERGGVFLQDENGGLYPLAINREYVTVSVVPKEVTDPKAVTDILVTALGVDRSDMAARLAKQDDPYELIQKKVPDDAAQKIKDANLKGIHLDKESYRYYPAGDLASQVIGFVGMNGDHPAGQYGIEASWESVLRGEAGSVDTERDAAGRWIPIAPKATTPAKNGDSLVLTINRVIQYETTRILKDSLQKYGSESGSVVVMEPSTGKILAMVSIPEFDPNNYAQEDSTHFLNPILSSVYEPGSIMKPVTMAMGVDAGKVTPQTEYVDTGHVFEAGYDIKNAETKTYGRSNMMRVLDQSLNTGAIFVEKSVGNTLFSNYLNRFGFGTKTGVDLPAEVVGNLHNLDNQNANISFFTASFGQGVSVTPMQMIDSYAALANGGQLMKPQIVDTIIHPDGTREAVPPTVVRRVVGMDTAKTMGMMLRDVVVNGHGKKADVPGYLVGGKTGTAQVPKVGGGGYQDNVNIGSFVGYAPVNDPKFVVLTKMDNPKNVEWAESSAAPVFGDVMKFLLEYAKVKPTEPVK